MQEKIDFQEVDERLYGVPLVGGLLAGIVSFVAGYLAFLGIAAGTGDGLDADNPLRSLQEVGHFFYNSFLVPTYNRRVAITEQQLEDTDEGVIVEEQLETWFNPFVDSEETVHHQIIVDGQTLEDNTFSNPVGDVGLTFPAELYLAIPVVVLLLVGAVFSYRFIDRNAIQTQKELVTCTLVGGGTITVGFLLVTLLGTYALAIEGEGSVVRPDRVDALLYGFTYPLVSASTGVLLGQLFRGRAHENQETAVGSSEQQVSREGDAEGVEG